MDFASAFAFDCDFDVGVEVGEDEDLDRDRGFDFALDFGPECLQATFFLSRRWVYILQQGEIRTISRLK